MPTFKVAYARVKLNDEGDIQAGVEREPEECEADHYTVDDRWITFWTTAIDDPIYAPPPVLQVLADDVARIEWLDQPDAEAESLQFRITYRSFVFREDGGALEHEDIVAGHYTMDAWFLRMMRQVGPPAVIDESGEEPPILMVRANDVTRIQQTGLSSQAATR